MTPFTLTLTDICAPGTVLPGSRSGRQLPMDELEGYLSDLAIRTGTYDGALMVWSYTHGAWVNARTHLWLSLALEIASFDPSPSWLTKANALIESRAVSLGLEDLTLPALTGVTVLAPGEEVPGSPATHLGRNTGLTPARAGHSFSSTIRSFWRASHVHITLTNKDVSARSAATLIHKLLPITDCHITVTLPPAVAAELAGHYTPESTEKLTSHTRVRRTQAQILAEKKQEGASYGKLV